MSRAESPRNRFELLRSRLEAIRAQLSAPPSHTTVIVDLGDLEIKCGRFQEQLDRLSALPETPSIDRDLGKLLSAIQVAVDDIEMCCADLKVPLDRLRESVYEHLSHDSEDSNEAS